MSDDPARTPPDDAGANGNRAYLEANRDDLARFIPALFRYADIDTFVSLRAFDQLERDKPPLSIRAARLYDNTFTNLIEHAVTEAQRCANTPQPSIFAPPVCTFHNAKRARGVDLANGLALSLDLDSGNTTAARQRLESILGPPTVVVASGGYWADPETGEIFKKLHLHWRLSEPTRDEESHNALRQARALAARLIAADPSGTPIVHCLRWPGSWNTKAKPVLATIVALNESAEINLTEALDALEGAIETAGIAAVPTAGKSAEPKSTELPETSLALLARAMAAIPNAGTDVPMTEYIRLGYAVYNATGGSDEGFQIWDTWARKSDKYHGGTVAAWERIGNAIKGARAPRPIGAGTIFYYARQAGWRWPQITDDPEYQKHVAAEADERIQRGKHASGGRKATSNGGEQPPIQPPGTGDGGAPPLPPEPPEPEPGPKPKTSTVITGPTPGPGPQPANVIEELNLTYAVVNEGGTVRVFARRHDPDLGWAVYDRMHFNDFRSLHNNKVVQVGTDDNGQPITVPLGSHWLKHSKRREYTRGVVYDPQNKYPDPYTLNLWEGFAVQPRQGAWAKVHDHIRDILCGSVASLFDYVMDWSANLVQHPELQGNVVIVLIGREGAGKAILAHLLVRMLARHAVAISNPQHLTGKFNAHFQYCSFCFLDEAPEAGKSIDASVLRSMATEDYLMLEAKHRNAFQGRNRLHIMLASNENFVIPAGLDSRRWLIIKVLEDRIGDTAYFDAIHKQLDDDHCIAAALFDLLNRKITSNLRIAPVTAALQDHRKRSLKSFHQWWHHVLARGYVWESQLGLSDYFGHWHECVPTELLHRSYLRFCRERRLADPLSREWLGRSFREMKVKRWRVAQRAAQRCYVTGEEIADVPTGAGSDHTTRKARLIEKDRPPGYRLGSLNNARSVFEKATKLPFDWEKHSP
jgi:hypothetical protein